VQICARITPSIEERSSAQVDTYATRAECLQLRGELSARERAQPCDTQTH
jgi:hypothetical protein